MIQIELNAALSQCGSRFSLAVTGAGATGASAFFSEAGSSAFLDDVQLPWSQYASGRLCGEQGLKAVCEDTAKRLARGVWAENYSRRGTSEVGLGIGMTGKLAFPGERIGREHEVWVAAYSYPDQRRFKVAGIEVSYLTRRMVPEQGTRHEQEAQASQFLHQFMVWAAEEIRR